MKANKPSFEQVEKALLRANSQADAAEAHGMLCGLLAVSGKADMNSWIAQVMGDADPRNVAVNEAQSLLMDMHDMTVEQLSSGEFDLQLLLPSDEVDLQERVNDLTDWCQGFLFGMSEGGVQNVETLPGEVGEIVRDIVDISKAGYDAGEEDESEENEAAYMEIVEYLRMGVLLVHTEFSNKNDDGSKPTIH